jgi:hypothetical protein
VSRPKASEAPPGQAPLRHERAAGSADALRRPARRPGAAAHLGEVGQRVWREAWEAGPGAYAP